MVIKCLLTLFFIIAEFSFSSQAPILFKTFPKEETLRPTWIEHSLYQVDSVRSPYPLMNFVDLDTSFIQWHPLTGLSLYRGDKLGYKWEGGLWVEAKKENFFAWVDARIYTVPNELKDLDGQFTDSNDKRHNEELSYVSFGRFTGMTGFQTKVGNVSAGRDAINWGGSRNYSLLFNGRSIPLDHISYEVKVSDFTVRTLWGVAEIRDQSDLDSLIDRKRHIFGHRYTWSPNPNFQLSISEQLVIYDYNAPQYFIPVYPLFIAKSHMPEEINNGNISLDLEWIFLNRQSLFGEMMIDDIESPVTFFSKNMIQNKWGVNVGYRNEMNFFNGTLTNSLEFVSVEPFVYSHFEDNKAQAVNGTRPIGVIEGPAYQSFLLEMSYSKNNWRATTRPKVERKGVLYGANWKDNTPQFHKIPKEYYKQSEWIVSTGISIEYSWKEILFLSNCNLINNEFYEIGILWTL